MIIGLTGGIATGKSTVSNMLREQGIPIVDADVIARQVVEPGEEAYDEIVKHFGSDILTENETIDRKMLGSIIFADDNQRLQLNKIVHPAIRKEMKRQINELKALNNDLIVLDIPLLIESNLQSLAHKIVVVYVPETIQLQRLMDRDKISKEEAIQKIQSQMPIEEKKTLADIVLHNEGSLEETKKQVTDLLEKLKDELTS